MSKNRVSGVHKEKRFTILVGCDFHVPFQDDLAVSTWINFAKYLKPDVVVLHEVTDMFALSKFSKDPKRATELQEELDQSYRLLKLIRKTVGKKTRIILLESNHQFRIQKYLQDKAPELTYLRSLKIENLLSLKELNIESRKEITIRGVLFKHGSVVRKESGATATTEMNATGCTGVSGHSHRLSQVYKRLQGGFYCWIESGCLCGLDPEYTHHPNWQQGCAVVQFVKHSKRFYATTVPIIAGKILWGHRTIQGGK